MTDDITQCLNQFFRPKIDVKVEGVGNCTICEPDYENNKDCVGYFPITVFIGEIKMNRSIDNYLDNGNDSHISNLVDIQYVANKRNIDMEAIQIGQVAYHIHKNKHGSFANYTGQKYVDKIEDRQNYMVEYANDILESKIAYPINGN